MKIFVWLAHQATGNSDQKLEYMSSLLTNGTKYYGKQDKKFILNIWFFFS